MKTRILNHVDEHDGELDQIEVQQIAKHSDRNCTIVQYIPMLGGKVVFALVRTVHESVLEIPESAMPRPRHFPFVDPLEIMNRGTKRVYSSIYPSLAGDRNEPEARSMRIRDENPNKQLA